MSQKYDKTDGCVSLDTNYSLLNTKNLADSDIDISFKSMSEDENARLTKNLNNVQKCVKTDSLTQSDRPSDGYETCMDESLSEEIKNTLKSKQYNNLIETELCSDAQLVQNNNTKSSCTINIGSYDVDDLTPTNSRVNIVTDQILQDVPESSGQNYVENGK